MGAAKEDEEEGEADRCVGAEPAKREEEGQPRSSLAVGYATRSVVGSLSSCRGFILGLQSFQYSHGENHGGEKTSRRDDGVEAAALVGDDTRDDASEESSRINDRKLISMRVEVSMLRRRSRPSPNRDEELTEYLASVGLAPLAFEYETM